MKKNNAFQDCNDRVAWPFATVARAAAATSPQVVIHVGDYLYREAPCPDGHAGCHGSPFGDNWLTWRADFFDPAAPLLAAAPWVVVRGDHEACGRADGGYFRFLDPRPLSATCEPTSPLYRISLGTLSLFMLDSSHGTAKSPDPVSDYSEQLKVLSSPAANGAWLLTHMPIWGLRGSHGGNTPKSLTQSLQDAAAGVDLRQIQQVLSGHIHTFQALTVAVGAPMQLVVGNGGTALDPEITEPLAGLSVGSVSVRNGVSRSRFGFVVLEMNEANGEWVSRLRGIDGEPDLICEKVGAQRDLNCR